ncbi:hypothetical protein GIB67_026438 [Kingdonia uniflora]|uniref:Mon2/Sec7/BIG1-like HDS domain-containing protein n=1 Tax=Kingdonia uniflora TaxID=39325 RepID=A0A7J7P6H8_9MAGN|nr:hypothetical protein GIB67_026438 [Kingdonia uniflora]
MMACEVKYFGLDELGLDCAVHLWVIRTGSGLAMPLPVSDFKFSNHEVSAFSILKPSTVLRLGKKEIMLSEASSKCKEALVPEDKEALKVWTTDLDHCETSTDIIGSSRRSRVRRINLSSTVLSGNAFEDENCKLICEEGVHVNHSPLDDDGQRSKGFDLQIEEDGAKVWARIWSVLAYHFISAGSHHDEKIAMYAIDSLRQLGMKYLERAELTNFTFQNDILKPFVVLMRNSKSESIRGLIVDCIVQMIKSKVGSIKSGWRSVFMIFTAAADDELESIVESAFENVEQVILEHFDQVVGDCFMDCVNCLIGFANNKTSHRISLKAIALLRICEDRLAEVCFLLYLVEFLSN